MLLSGGFHVNILPYCGYVLNDRCAYVLNDRCAYAHYDRCDYAHDDHDDRDDRGHDHDDRGSFFLDLSALRNIHVFLEPDLRQVKSEMVTLIILNRIR